MSARLMRFPGKLFGFERSAKGKSGRADGRQILETRRLFPSGEKIQNGCAEIVQVKFSFFSATCTMRAGSEDGIGGSRTAFAALKIALVAPDRKSDREDHGRAEDRRPSHDADCASNVV